ncbi:MAG: class I SAM-dependent methyltransferase [Methylococcales bacterium]
MEKDNVAKFYDAYVEKQIVKGYNDRHILLNEFLMNMGMNEESSILELGCGIGTITSLLTKTVKKGKIVSVDISEESINQSKKTNKENNIEFIVSDLLSFKYDDFKFDFIVLFDVLEHVPQEQHASIFKKIAPLMNEKSKLIIHVPSKEIIHYCEDHSPEVMQIIDQPLSESKMIMEATSSGLRIEEFKFTNIWEEHDYQLFVFIKQFKFDKTKKIIRKVGLKERIKNKLK